MKKYNGIIFLGQLPPPSHGASLLNEKALKILKSKTNVFFINYNFSTTLEELGGVSLSKLYTLIGVFFKIIKFRFEGVRCCYFSANVTGVSFYRDYIVSIFLRALGIDVTFHLHGKGLAENSSNTLKNIMYKTMFNRSRVICVSQSLAKREFSSINISEVEIGWATNGIPVPKLYSKLKHKNGITLMHMSNLRKSKGVMDCLVCLAALVEKGMNANLEFIGSFRDSKFEKECQKFISDNKLENRVIFNGPLYGQEKYQKLATADVFLYPTYDDSFGLVVIEALSQQVPVIAYDEGSLMEIISTVEGSSFVVKKGDVNELIYKTSYLLEHKHQVNDVALRESVVMNFNSERFRSELEKFIVQKVLK